MELFTDGLDLDIQILQNGPISMYFKQEILDEDLDQLESLGYKIVRIDTTNWNVKKAHKDLQTELGFPDYYGNNLNAFNDCLGDQISTNQKGLVIVFTHFDKIPKNEREFCMALLDIISIQSRQWLIVNKRLIGLVQSSDPDLYLDKVGGIQPFWNGREWYNDDRK